MLADLAVDPAAEHGQILTGQLEVVRGDESDHSGFMLTVVAPDLRLTAVTTGGGPTDDTGAAAQLPEPAAGAVSAL